MILLLGSKLFDLLCSDLSKEKALLLESENMFMKLRIQQLEFELETEKIRSRHFEGLSQIALLELKRGNWVNSNERGRRFSKAFLEVKELKLDLSKCVQKLEEVVSSVNNLF